MNTIKNQIYDCIGIGFGPSNIALAVYLEELGLINNMLFLEKSMSCSWHPEMMLNGTDIQHNPLRDLVTPRNPRSKYGFLSYLQHHKRLFDYLNLSAPFPPRSEYAEYVRWVSSHFYEHVKLNTEVVSLDIKETGAKKNIIEIKVKSGQIFLARSIVIGTGRTVNIPRLFSPLIGDKVIHLTKYLSSIKSWINKKKDLSLAVVGGSQSAIEIILDVLNNYPETSITSIIRSFGFKQKDLSPFTEQIYYPDFVDYFFKAGTSSQREMTQELWRSNYSAADHDVINDLNFKLYEQKVSGINRLTLLHNQEILSAEKDETNNLIIIDCFDKYSRERHKLNVDAIILATGFKNFGSFKNQEPILLLLNNLKPVIKFRADGGVEILRDYRLSLHDELSTLPIFMNGLCESSHGFGDAGSFSLIALRAQVIGDSIKQMVNAEKASLQEDVVYGA